VLCVELLAVLTGWKFAPDAVRLPLSPSVPAVSNTAALGAVLYTDYIFLFQAAGLVLLVAMIGAIVLTHRDRRTSRHQSIRVQTERSTAETLEMLDIGLGVGTKTTGFYRPKPKTAEPVAAHDSPGDGAHGGGHHAPEVR
jgi:NADH-quinone oxidoreductase subunit J